MAGVTLPKKMEKERKLTKLLTDVSTAVDKYKETVEKWIKESDYPLSLHDGSNDSIIGAGVEICFIADNSIKTLLVDMIKYDKPTESILVHQLRDGSNLLAKWIPASIFQDQIIDVYKSILWLEKEDLVIVDGDTHSGTANLVYSFSKETLYFIHQDGHIVDVDWYNSIDDFIGVAGEFAVHQYAWSNAMREIDEHEQENEEEYENEEEE